jgi:hypothetical protein
VDWNLLLFLKDHGAPVAGRVKLQDNPPDQGYILFGAE